MTPLSDTMRRGVARSHRRPVLVPLALVVAGCSGGSSTPADAGADGRPHADATLDGSVDGARDATFEPGPAPHFDAGDTSAPGPGDAPCILPSPTQSSATRVAALSYELGVWAGSLENSYAAPDGGLTCPGPASGLAVKDLVDYALTAIVRAQPGAAANASSMLECAFTRYQAPGGADAGKNAGAFYLRTTDTGPNVAANATELALQPLPAILASGQIPDAVVADLTPRIALALGALERHPVPIGETNVWLMQAMELSLLGDFVAAHTVAAPDAGKDGGRADAAIEGGGHDAGLDAPREAGGADAGADAAEAGLDAPLADTGRDAASEGGADATVDAGHDAAGDASTPPSYSVTGRARLAAWVAFTRAGGVSEYDTPVEYAIDLATLWVGYQVATGDDRATYAAILGSFWADIAASTLLPRGSIEGPVSRLTDFVRAHGDLEIPLYLEGLRFGTPVALATTPTDFAAAFPLYNATGAGYHPAEGTLCLSQGSRVVRSTFVADGGDAAMTGRQRYEYFTPDLAVGSASQDYAPGAVTQQDEPIRAAFASFDMPLVTVLPDYLDSPGVVPTGVALTSASHLALEPVAVQQGGAMLALLRVSAKDPIYRGTDGGFFHVVDLSTNVLFPAGADELFLNDAGLDPSHLGGLPIQSTLVLRVGAGAIAVRVLDSTGVECPSGATVDDLDSGVSALLSLAQNVGPGSTQNVGRLALYHLAHANVPSYTTPLAPCFARVALLVVGEECQIAGCAASLASLVESAAVRDTWDPTTETWDVAVSLPPIPAADAGAQTLHVRRVLSSDAGVPPVREVNDASVSFLPLQVDDAAAPAP